MLVNVGFNFLKSHFKNHFIKTEHKVGYLITLMLISYKSNIS